MTKNLLRSNYRTARSGRCHSRNQEYKSVHGRPAAALLVLLPGAARARIIPPGLGNIAPRLARVGIGTGLPMLPEVPIRPQQSSRHVHDDFFALLWADRFGPHLRVFVVLVAERHHGDQASAVLLSLTSSAQFIVVHGPKRIFAIRCYYAPKEGTTWLTTLGLQNSHADLVSRWLRWKPPVASPKSTAAYRNPTTIRWKATTI